MTRPPTISEIECRIVKVPVVQERANSPEFGAQPLGPQRLILRLRDGEGFEGWGEGRSGTEDFEEVLPRLLGRAVSELRPQYVDLWAAGSQYWQLPTPPSPYAAPMENYIFRLRHPMQPLVEMALMDLIGRRANVPMYVLMGGKWRDVVPTDYWMGRTTPEHAARCARRGKELGFHGIKGKAALADPNVERLEAIKEACGADFKVTVDPNSRFYRHDDALETILAMDAVGNLGILEDPFPRHFLGDYALIRPKIRARLAVHIDPPESMYEVIRSNACGAINIDSHTQGLWGWQHQASACEWANIPVWHGSSLDLGLMTAAQLHACAATPNCQLPGDQVGPWIRESHLLKKDFVVERGGIRVPEGAGLGVDVDPDALERYTTKVKKWKA